MINIFWFRRDLRLHDNTGLIASLASGLPVLPLFIFDTAITGELPTDDPRITFIYNCLSKINQELASASSSLLVMKGRPAEVWDKLINDYTINEVFANRDYEPYARDRDEKTGRFLASRGVKLSIFKDQVIFEENEIVKSDGLPYTVFTPYKKRWVEKYRDFVTHPAKPATIIGSNFLKCSFRFPSLKDIGFNESAVSVKPFNTDVIENYHNTRDLPAVDGTTGLSPHLRFGCVSIREICSVASEANEVFLGELIWREFFMQILWHFPYVVTGSFRKKYDRIRWNRSEEDFEKWCRGETGYPMVDAGMRQLNLTGYMHNRVRMVTASFLCKHLLIDWRLGEAYFASKLLDYELSSNNGNWQWAAGSGCDAAPYFRVFNPDTQQKKFDPDSVYIRRWIEDYESRSYPARMVDHDFARKRAISTYRQSLES